jgi:hypothetical protein
MIIQFMNEKKDKQSYRLNVSMENKYKTNFIQLWQDHKMISKKC